jgi:hypothetical protein
VVSDRLEITTMKKLLVLSLLAAPLFASLNPALAAAPKTYQVTGPVLEVRADAIVVQKGKEKWEILRAADTKVSGDLKVGAKVTIEYKMTATTVEAKDDGKADTKAKK